MKKTWIIILCILVLPSLFYFVLDSKANGKTNKINSANKVHIIKFSSPMCSECERLEKVFVKVKPKYQKDVIFEEIQVQERDKNTKNKITEYTITLVPTMVFIDKNGQIQQKIEGFLSEEELELAIKGLLKQ